MPARDTIHDVVKQAIIKDGWLFTDDPERELYLAIPGTVYSDIFSEPIGKLVIAELPLKLLVVNTFKIEVSQWIPPLIIEK